MPPAPPQPPQPPAGLRGSATDLLPHPSTEDQPSTRTVLRIVVTVLIVIGVLALIRLLWQPIAWILIASFIAIALSGPVNVLQRRMRRGLAIATVYLSVVLVPVVLTALIVPPLVRQAVEFAEKLPQYADDLEQTIQKNERLNKLDEDLGLTERLNELATDAPDQIGTVAGVLRDLGTGLVNSVFAGFTIFVLSIFMVARGRRWIDMAIEFRGGPHVGRLKATMDRIAAAVGNYVAGAIVQATVAGVTAFIVLSALGVPFAGALALLVALFDLIPLVGATIAAVLVGVVTVFNDFPVDTIIWAVFAIAYQQFENYVIQPQIQKRAVELEPFVVLTAVLFGGTLFGIVGALLAIPVAATIQIAVQEWWRYRLAEREEAITGEGPPPPQEAGPAEGSGGPSPAPA